MKKKRLIIIIFIGIILLILLLIKNKINNRTNDIQEYTPQEEISEEENRETMITLYFENKNDKKIVSESKKIDANNLIKNPYEFILNELFKGPKNQELNNLIPDGTKLNSAKLNGDILYIDLSRDFIKVEGDKEENVINQLLYTSIQLNEVNGIKIIIDGEENKSFLDGKINFENIFKVKSN